MTQKERLRLIALLERRYGDGSLYFRDEQDRQVLNRAVSLGLVSMEGYLTGAGKRFLQTGTLDDPPATTGGGAANYEMLDGDGF